MKKHTFVVIAYAPEGVMASEIADHLADASRSMCAEYAGSDPLSRLPDLQIFGSVPRSELPASSVCDRAQPPVPVPVLG